MARQDTTLVPTKEPVIAKVPHTVRHAATLRRKAAVKPMIEERKRRQKKSRQNTKKSIVKPSSGHKSLRPNKGAKKRSKLKKASINA